MARAKRTQVLETKAARLKLPVRRKPYFTKISPGVALGFRRNKGDGAWLVRVADGSGGNWTDGFAVADDFHAADKRRVLTYWQARDRALEIAGVDHGSDKPVTVAAALDAYEADLRSRGGDIANARVIRYHLAPALGAKLVTALTARDLKQWRDGIVAKGLKPSSAKRMSHSLKAALNGAAANDPRITNTSAWRIGLAALPDADEARNVILPEATIRDIVSGAYDLSVALGDPTKAFGLFLETMAVTGARQSQLFVLKSATCRTAKHRA